MKRKRGSMLDLLGQRQLNPGKARVELQEYAEDKAAHFELEEMPCKLPVSVRSTFLMCFSPNGSRVASTHGDHRIYVCQVTTGKLLKTLEGHPRTPWCLAFHPTCNDLLASGCLGGEVRVWDLRGGGSEVWLCPERSVITSLSFHPMENFIALSTVNRVHFWDWSKPEPFATTKTNSEKEKVRLVRFTPQGDYLLTGITNQVVERPQPHRRCSILHRLATMYHRLVEMLPTPQQSTTAQRRIARRGGVRRVNHDDLRELLRMRYSDRHTSLYLRQRSDRSRSGSMSAQEREEHAMSPWFLLDLRRRSAYPAQNDPDVPGFGPSAADATSGTSSRPSGSAAGSAPSSSASSTSDLPSMNPFQNSPPFTPFATHPGRPSAAPPSSASSSRPPTSSFASGSTFTSPPTSTSTFAANATSTSLPTTSSSSAPDQNSNRATEGAQGAGRNRAENSELWETFNRLRMLCTRLESRMMRHGGNFPGQPPPASASAEAAAGAAAGSSASASPFSPMMAPLFSSSPPGQPSTSRVLPETMTPPPPPPPPPRERPRSFGASLDPPNSQDIPISLVHLLGRLQESLQSLSDATALTGMTAARRQIREVRIRISDILERLESVSEYRERLRSLRAQIVRAAARMYDPGDEEEQVMALSSPQWDLAYCLWLVDMSLRLTNEMQRILTADYRSTRLHVMRDRDRSSRARRARFDDERASGSASASPNLLIFESSDSESDSDNDGDRPNIPPFTPPPRFRPPQYFYPRYAGPGLGTYNAISHRIQYWSINKNEPIPQISKRTAQLVVSTCKIHNDGSVDVSPCGRLLVALVPDLGGVTLSVFSLTSDPLGQVLYTWGFGPNAVSVSFSPLSRYVVVGLASSRYMSPQREVVAQIFRLGERPTQGQTGSSLLEHVANMSQPLLGAHASHQLISLNCVRWLPNPGEGLVYGTNRGTLCICRPLCSFCHECSSDGGSSRDEGSSHLGTTRRDSSFQTLSQHIEETATRHALLGRRP